MPSTDLDGSPLLILGIKEAKLVKTALSILPELGINQPTVDGILKKIADVENYERKRHDNQCS